MKLYETEGNNAAELIISTPHGIRYTLIPLHSVTYSGDTGYPTLLIFLYHLLRAISN